MNQRTDNPMSQMSHWGTEPDSTGPERPGLRASPAAPPGPPEDIASLYEAHAEALARYIMARSADPDLAREAVQECFLRYLQSVKRGDAICNPRAWLFRVAQNYLLDQLRRDAHISDEPPPPSIASRETDPESLIAAADIHDQIKKRLSSREHECSLLRAGGFSYEEIARVMNVRPGTVGAMLSRASRKLKSLRHPERAPNGREAAYHSE
jgi:RNA polymerase sigma-70 factor (ECF subfamily)